MSVDPYTRDEMTDDVLDWQTATVEQRNAVFDELMAIVSADAYSRQDIDLIQRLRRMRANRDRGQS